MIRCACERCAGEVLYISAAAYLAEHDGADELAYVESVAVSRQHHPSAQAQAPA